MQCDRFECAKGGVWLENSLCTRFFPSMTGYPRKMGSVLDRFHCIAGYCSVSSIPWIFSTSEIFFMVSWLCMLNQPYVISSNYEHVSHRNINRYLYIRVVRHINNENSVRVLIALPLPRKKVSMCVLNTSAHWHRPHCWGHTKSQPPCTWHVAVRKISQENPVILRLTLTELKTFTCYQWFIKVLNICLVDQEFQAAGTPLRKCHNFGVLYWPPWYPFQHHILGTPTTWLTFLMSWVNSWSAPIHSVRHWLIHNIPHIEVISAISEMSAKCRQLHGLPHSSYLMVLLKVFLTKKLILMGDITIRYQTRPWAQKLVPSHASLFMIKCKEQNVYTYPLQAKLWKRFTDDIFLMCLHGYESLQEFEIHLHTVLTTIKFTSEPTHIT